MDISTEREGNALIAKLNGRIDGSNAVQFEEAMKHMLQEESTNFLILDLEKVSYISSIGLRIIAITINSTHDTGTSMSVCSMPTKVKDVFFTSGFNQLVPVHETRAQATAAAAAAGAS